MQTKYLPILAAAAATTVSASASQVTQVDVVHIIETLQVGKHIPSFTPNKRSLNAIFARDNDAECQSSFTSILLSFPTPKPAIESWARTAETTQLCVIQAPTSLSSDLMAYLTAVNEWAVEKDGDLNGLVGKCLEEEDVENAGGVDSCPTPGTILFTADKTTDTVFLKTALATFTPGAASATKAPNAGATGAANSFAAAAAVGVAAFMVAA
ncbi:Ff.00g068960.m01.CDS01 [Fusarium sp. VM40]|nr:Ff.00g068960.m01.CDS01 [Fusarium sp. VM40]